MELQRTKALADRLSGLGRNEKQKLYKEAAKLRREAERKRPGSRHILDDEFEEDIEVPVRHRTSLDEWVIKLLDAGARIQEANAVPETTGSVVAIRGPRHVVEIGSKRRDCTVRAERNGLRVAIGDLVAVDASRIVEVMPRRTKLARPDPGAPAKELVVVANVDLIVVVVSVLRPPLHPRLIDRYLVAIEQGGAQPAVCVNKIDLAATQEELEAELDKLRPYRALGIRVVECSAERAEGLAELRALLAGKVSAFVGHSGVGKTSILNALQPGLGLRTGGVHDGSGQGRHTTTSSTIFDIGDGARVVDTPGIRSFGLDFAGPAELLHYFPDLAGFECRFGDCTHLHEPDCGVKAAVQKGWIVRERYETYKRLAGVETVEETFDCRHCGASVTPQGGGTEHRNHCPRCLHSVHLDVEPGDRGAGCGGLMEPVAVWVRRGGEWALIHRCRSCGRFGSNRIAADDNETLLLSLAVRPLAQPPFPLERM